MWIFLQFREQGNAKTERKESVDTIVDNPSILRISTLDGDEDCGYNPLTDSRSLLINDEPTAIETDDEETSPSAQFSRDENADFLISVSEGDIKAQIIGQFVKTDKGN